MTTDTNNTTQEPEGRPVVRRKRRMSAKVRTAIDLMVTKGATQRDAAKQANMNEGALSRALARPAVQLHLQEEKALFAMEVNDLEASLKKLALLAARDLIMTGPPAQKAKMVELFAVEGKKSPSITINNNVNSKGYEYVQPGQRVVEIVDAEVLHDQDETQANKALGHTVTDSLSPAHDTQPVDNAEE